MDIRLVAPELQELDETSAELCACTIWSDERPVRGFADLIDWRLGGRLSALLKAGFLTGERDEALLIPAKPHLPFEKALVIGLGAREGFGEEAFRSAVRHVARALEGLRVRRAVVELPGRARGVVGPRDAISWTLDCIGDSPEHDVWWLVEGSADGRIIQERAADERRRLRTG